MYPFKFQISLCPGVTEHYRPENLGILVWRIFKEQLHNCQQIGIAAWLRHFLFVCYSSTLLELN